MPRLEADVATWVNKPRFWCRYAAGKVWWIRFGYDRRTKAGRIYTYVDRGTASYAGGSPYTIRPRRASALSFVVPHKPKTTPGIVGVGPGIVRAPGVVQQARVVTKKVTHPGVRPRNFQESLRDGLADRQKPGGFKSVTDAAVKRALRRISNDRG